MNWETFVHTVPLEILGFDLFGALREFVVLAVGALRELRVRDDMSEHEFLEGGPRPELYDFWTSTATSSCNCSGGTSSMVSWRIAGGACSFEPWALPVFYPKWIFAGAYRPGCLAYTSSRCISDIAT